MFYNQYKQTAKSVVPVLLMIFSLMFFQLPVASAVDLVNTGTPGNSSELSFQYHDRLSGKFSVSGSNYSTSSIEFYMRRHSAFNYSATIAVYSDTIGSGSTEPNLSNLVYTVGFTPSSSMSWQGVTGITESAGYLDPAYDYWVSLYASGAGSTFYLSNGATGGFTPLATTARFDYSSSNTTLGTDFGVRITGNTPTLVDLSYFKAVPKSRKIVLKWKTDSETYNSGFNILRSNSKKGEYLAINDDIILSKANDAVGGAKYSFSDKNVETGKKYYYKLVDIEIGGKENDNGTRKAKVTDKNKRQKKHNKKRK